MRMSSRNKGPLKGSFFIVKENMNFKLNSWQILFHSLYESEVLSYHDVTRKEHHQISKIYFINQELCERK